MKNMLFVKLVVGVALVFLYVWHLMPYISGYNFKENSGWLIVYIIVFLIMLLCGAWLLSLLVKLLSTNHTRDVPAQVEYEVYANGSKRIVQIASLCLCFCILIAGFIFTASDARTTPLVLLISGLLCFVLFLSIVSIVSMRTGRRNLADVPAIAHSRDELDDLLGK